MSKFNKLNFYKSEVLKNDTKKILNAINDLVMVAGGAAIKQTNPEGFIQTFRPENTKVKGEYASCLCSEILNVVLDFYPEIKKGLEV